MSGLKKKNTDTYEGYIYKILKREYPEIRISKKALRVMDDLISQIFVDVKKRVLELVNIDNLKIIKFRAIRFAFKIEMPHDIGIYCDLGLHLAIFRYHGENQKHLRDTLVEYGFDKYANPSKNEWITKSNDPLKRSKKSGIIFDVGRVERHLRQHTTNHVSDLSSVAFAAALDILTRYIIKATVSQLGRKKTISPREIMLAISNDEELKEMFKNYVIMNAGVPLN